MTEQFRRQAVDHQRKRFHGAIVLTRSPWQTAVATLFVLLVLLVVFACARCFARKESVSDVLRLVAPQAGVVLATPAAQRVAAGQEVVALSTEQASASGPTQTASLDARVGAAAGLAQQERQIALQRERVQLVRDLADRYPDLVSSASDDAALAWRLAAR
jgi:membrane fusion protein